MPGATYVDTVLAMTSIQILKTEKWLQFRGIEKSKNHSVNSYENSWE
jgi:hypothetical protein